MGRRLEKTFFQRGHADGKQVPEKTLNIANCQGNQNGDSPAQASEVGEKASNQILTLSGPLPGLHACLKAHQLLSVSQVAL